LLYLLSLPRNAEKLKVIAAYSLHSSSVMPPMIPMDPAGSIPHRHGADNLTASPPLGRTLILTVKVTGFQPMDWQQYGLPSNETRSDTLRL
jgi:hypothetical protein